MGNFRFFLKIIGPLFCLLWIGLPTISLADQPADPYKVELKQGKGGGYFSMKIGTFGPGTGRLGGSEGKIGTSYSMAIGVDVPVTSRFSLGSEIAIFVLKSAFQVPYGADSAATMVSVFGEGAYLLTKPKVPLYIQVSGGIGVGYIPEIVKGGGATNYLLWKVTSEFGVMTSQHYGLGVEVGCLWGKSGFGNEYDITAGPFPFVRAVVRIK